MGDRFMCFNLFEFAMTMDAIKKDSKCMEMAKMHPDMMKATGAMAPKSNMTPTMPAKK